MAESGNILAQGIGQFGRGFTAAYSQGIDQNLQSRGLMEQTRQFDAQAPNRAADVGLKHAETQDINTNQGLKPTPEMARSRYAAETENIGASAEAARANALQSKASAARTTALTPAEVALVTNQGSSVAQDVSSKQFENSGVVRGLKTTDMLLSNQEKRAKIDSIPFMQDMEKRRLDLAEREFAAKTDTEKADIEIKKSELANMTRRTSFEMAKSINDEMSNLYKVRIEATSKTSEAIQRFAGHIIQNHPEMSIGSAFQQAADSVKKWIPTSIVAEDPAKFNSLSSGAQDAISKLNQAMSDPKTDPDVLQVLLNKANASAHAALIGSLTPPTPDSRPTDSRPSTSQAESRRTELRSRIGESANTPQGKQAIEDQLSKEGVIDVKVGGVSINPTPNYSLPGNVSKRGWEFDKFVSENPDIFDKAFAEWRASNGSDKESDSEAYDRYKLEQLSKGWGSGKLSPTARPSRIGTR